MLLMKRVMFTLSTFIKKTKLSRKRLVMKRLFESKYTPKTKSNIYLFKRTMELKVLGSRKVRNLKIW